MIKVLWLITRIFVRHFWTRYTIQGDNCWVFDPPPTCISFPHRPEIKKKDASLFIMIASEPTNNNKKRKRVKITLFFFFFLYRIISLFVVIFFLPCAWLIFLWLDATTTNGLKKNKKKKERKIRDSCCWRLTSMFNALWILHGTASNKENKRKGGKEEEEERCWNLKGFRWLLSHYRLTDLYRPRSILQRLKPT